MSTFQHFATNPFYVFGQGRRLRVLEIAPHALVGFLRSLDGTSLVRVEGLPEDAVILSTDYTFLGGPIRFLVHSNSFPIVPEGSSPAVLDLTVTTHHIPAPRFPQ